MEVSSLNNSIPKISTNTNTESQPVHVQPSESVKVQAPTPTPQMQEVINEYMKQNSDNSGNAVRQHVQDIKSEEVEKQMRDIVDKINSRLTTNTEVNFSFHARSNRLNIKIVDKNTKEVVKEWPSEKSLDLLAKLIDKEAIVLDKRL